MSIKKNYYYNLFYQILSIILPIITTPYISRVFTANEIGVNAYTASIAQYFILLSSLGVGLYANKVIARVKDEQSKIDKYFWAIFFAKSLTTAISLIMYAIVVVFVIGENEFIYFLQAINIISIAFDISWLFIGLEQFKNVVMRNTMVRLSSVVCILLFVKDVNDLGKYIFILAASNLIGMLVMWIYVPKFVSKFYFEPEFILKQIKPLLKLFIPQVISMVYSVLDKTMLGIFSTQEQVGFYDQSQKIIKILQTVITSLTTVMIPRISYLLANNNHEEVRRYMEKTFKYMSYLAFPITFGLFAVAEDFSVWFFGSAFWEVGPVLKLNAFVIIAVSCGYLIGLQYLIPSGREKELSLSYTLAAVLNFVLNLFMLKRFGAIGAVISTIVAEFAVAIVQFFFVRKELDVLKMLRGCTKSLIACIIMVLVISPISLKSLFITTIIKAIVGMIVYFSVMFILKSDIQKEVIKTVLKIK
ncbi:MAG: flippase [Clostridium celatum]|nr:flippase [Clostridium celatum]